MDKLFCLVLNRAFLPFDVIHWEKAITLEWLGRCLVIEYHPTRRVRSPSREYPLPIVVRVSSIRSTMVMERPTRMMIHYRDNFRCAYCGKTLRDNELTIDHVVPRSKGGKWTWENLVTCCVRCNRAKRQEIWVPTYTDPVKPRFLFTRYLKVARLIDPPTREVWNQYLPSQHRWVVGR
ncbi:MAG: HNH endonuclease [Aquificota bacterium]|nr:MAG: HNH endonuclease [Aquificota bacterium]